jgi:hypothetical protein
MCYPHQNCGYHISSIPLPTHILDRLSESFLMISLLPLPAVLFKAEPVHGMAYFGEAQTPHGTGVRIAPSFSNYFPLTLTSSW